MKRNTIIALLLVCTIATLRAQNVTQALRFSRYNFYGTARFAAQGGSSAALGGDISAALINPAGLGLYRSSEFSFSSSFYWVNTESDFLGRQMDASSFRYNVASMGYVGVKNRRKQSGLVSASFAFGYNTLVNYKQAAEMGGTNTRSTMLDDFTWRANADPDQLDPFYEQTAFDAGLLPYDSIAGEFWNDIQDGGYGQQQNRFVDQWGYVGEYSISNALNIGNFLYFGATFGIHSVRFGEDIYHYETDPTDVLANISNFEFQEFNNTYGWGYTFRFGLIVRPIKAIRLGGTFQIPTYYYLTDEKYTNAYSTWDRETGWEDGSGFSPLGYYDYELKAPMRGHAHISGVLFKMATLSASYEYVDYSSARLNSYDDNFDDENQSIQNDLQDAHHFRGGAEMRSGPLYFRGGVQYLMSPYSDSRNDADEWIYSGGIGVRSKMGFLDISYSWGGTRQVYGLYDPGSGAPESSYIAETAVHRNNIIVSLGLRF